MRASHADGVTKAASVTRVGSVGAMEELQNEQQEHARLKVRYDEKMKAFAEERSAWKEGYEERGSEIAHLREMVRQAEGKSTRTIQSAAGRMHQTREEARYEIEGMRSELQAVRSAHAGAQGQIGNATARLQVSPDDEEPVEPQQYCHDKAATAQQQTSAASGGRGLQRCNRRPKRNRSPESSPERASPTPRRCNPDTDPGTTGSGGFGHGWATDDLGQHGQSVGWAPVQPTELTSAAGPCNGGWAPGAGNPWGRTGMTRAQKKEKKRRQGAEMARAWAQVMADRAAVEEGAEQVK
ncbi:hypothetical protein CVIRNUC_007412 [Coccomyxa viridis]|uniref:Uncharacterized protein n=1 Tax=Coccomyxa viridis TaxID=1274662 RepID=A0AAV1IAH3_9CHLO|nr:hypothetical protein CVIRNUC_007412 [Coccomyxa viridis]